MEPRAPRQTRSLAIADFTNIYVFAGEPERHFYGVLLYRAGHHEDHPISRSPNEPRSARHRRRRPWTSARGLFRRRSKLIGTVAAGPRLDA